jgi:hypothetical protein
MLKLESTLELDHSSGQTAFSLSEQRILDLCARTVEIERL